MTVNPGTSKQQSEISRLGRALASEHEWVNVQQLQKKRNLGWATSASYSFHTFPAIFPANCWLERGLSLLLLPPVWCMWSGHTLALQLQPMPWYYPTHRHFRACQLDRKALSPQVDCSGAMAGSLTFAASAWGSWPHTAPQGHSGVFWGCQWSTPASHAMTQ